MVRQDQWKREDETRVLQGYKQVYTIQIDRALAISFKVEQTLQA